MTGATVLGGEAALIVWPSLQIEANPRGGDRIDLSGAGRLMPIHQREADTIRSVRRQPVADADFNTVVAAPGAQRFPWLCACG